MKKLEILHEPYIKMLEREYMMYECQGEKSCQPEIQLFRWKDGKPDIRTNEEWEKLYLCITDTEHVICKGICKTQEPVKIPAYAQCECGGKIFPEWPVPWLLAVVLAVEKPSVWKDMK